MGSEGTPPSTGAIDAVSHRKDIERLSSLLEASEARGDAAQEEAGRLRAENNSLSEAVERSARLLNSLRTEYDRLRAETAEKVGHGSAALSETVRLRSHVVEIERELQRVMSRAEDASRCYVVEKQKAEALERVCMGLRRRVAIAEEKAQDEKKLQEALMARELAEAQLVEAKVEAERWRARSSAADITRERAETAERLERAQRDKIAALERELDSRESLLRQGMQEGNKLKKYMANYEKELEEKEMSIVRLRGLIKRRGYEEEEEGWSHQSGEAHAKSLGSDEDTASLSMPTGLGTHNEDRSGDWDGDITAQTGSSAADTAENLGRGSEFPEASPLRREVEEAHAQLLAAVGKPEPENSESLETDLSERVRRLEASMNKLAYSHSISPG